jgi:transcriptional regulator with XRE-family HTH domain
MSDQFSREVGERLKLFRESLNMGQAQLAATLDGTVGGYQKNEQGISAPNSKALSKLHGLGLNVNWLLSGEGPMLRTSLPLGAGAPADEDVRAYGDCVEILESALAKLGRTLAPEKKRIALDSMYRAWARDRKMDPRLVEMIVQLAA